MALRAAEDEGAIERSPAATVKAPTLGAREPVTMSPDEARAILRAFAGHRLGPAVTVALTTGLRLGEQLGLRWADWHGQRATISGAVRPLPRDDGTGYVLTRVATKTRRSVRTVELSAMAQAALSEQRRFQAEGTISEYVFAKPDGTMADPRLVTRAFQRHLALSGLPRLRWHDLRHGFATLQLANGVPLRVISESLGHASIGITANVYAHVLPSLQRDAVSRLDDLLSER
jgi:integrase